jgi:adenylate cyclase
MAAQDFKRKLTAILSADVKGYSRLMGEDDEATVRTITAYREVITEVVQKHKGRVVDSPGDNILAEFASVIDRNLRAKTPNCLKTAGWSFALELTLVM